MATKRYGMLIDLRKCVGCEACTVACKAENDVPLGYFRTRVQVQTQGTFPKVTRAFIPTLCNHCENPACVDVCPTGASFKRTEDGIVMINQDDCIGCRYCVSACPYGQRHMDTERAVADKCTFCAHRVDQGIVPSCVNTCVTACRFFGDLNDPESEISKAMKLPGVVRIEGTNMAYILPDNFKRDSVPSDYATPSPVGAWQNIIQPAGKVLLGGAAAAIAVSIAANAMGKGGSKEGDNHD